MGALSGVFALVMGVGTFYAAIPLTVITARILGSVRQRWR